MQQEPHWLAPSLWKSKFRKVLALYLRKNLLTLDEALSIVRQAETLLQQNDYEVSSSQVLQLVAGSDCSAYDCEFVALAKLLNIPLITADRKVLQAFPKIAWTIEDFWPESAKKSRERPIGRSRKG